MKKLSLLLGTLGGATAGYLFSNKKLRQQLADAEDAEEAARILGKALQQDGKKIGKELQEFIRSEEVQQNVTKAKKYAKKTVDDAKKELDAAWQSGSKKAKTSAKRAVKKGKTVAKKKVKTAKKGAKKAAKSMKTKMRKLS